MKDQIVALDLRTLSFVTLTFSFVCGCGLIAFGKKHRKFSCIALIGYGFLMMGAGLTLLGLREVIDNFLSIIVANSLIYCSLVATYQGLFRLLQISMPFAKYLSAAGLGILISILSYFTYQEYNVNARIIGFCCCYGSLYFLTIYGFIRSGRCFSDKPVRFLSVFFLIVGLYYVYRLFWTIDSLPLGKLMNAG
ncbi:MAG: hypothetical protein AAGA67_03095, partial [Cyanobacteria bacterium P01_F01_bin.153]